MQASLERPAPPEALSLPRFLRLVRSIVTIYTLVVAWAFWAEDGMVFLPQPSSYTDGPAYLKLTCADGKRITAAYVPHAGARYTIIYSHGNAEDVGENLGVMAHIAELGFNVLIYDYHGYGTSEGKPGERTSVLDLEAAYAYVTQTLKVPANRVILYGRSVGGGPTMAVATERPCRAVILESTFTDPASVRLPVRLLPWVMFPSLERIRTLHVPVLVMHGLADDLIPASHGQALYAAAPGPKACLWVAGAGHDDFKEVAGKAYDKAITAFARSL